jgi:hypothetical protein
VKLRRGWNSGKTTQKPRKPAEKHKPRAKYRKMPTVHDAQAKKNQAAEPHEHEVRGESEQK